MKAVAFNLRNKTLVGTHKYSVSETNTLDVNETSKAHNKNAKHSLSNYQRIKSKIWKFFHSLFYKISAAIVTLWALYWDDIKSIISNTNLIELFNAITSLLMIFLIIEIVILFIFDEEYGCSVYFFCDIIGTASWVLEYPSVNLQICQWLNNYEISNELFTFESLTVRKYFKIIRIFRLIRCIRFTKIIKEVKANNSADSISDTKFKDNDDDNNTKLSTKFDNETQRKIIILVICTLISITVLDIELYEKYVPNYELNIKIFNEMYPKNMKLFNISYNIFLNKSVLNTEHPWIYSNIFGYEYLKEDIETNIRRIDVVTVYDICEYNNTETGERGIDIDKYEALVKKGLIPSLANIKGKCVASYLNEKEIMRKSIINLIYSTWILIVFCFGFIFIGANVKNLVLNPIEKMIKKIKKMSKNPISSIEEDETNTNNTKQNYQMLETTILEKKISKICSLLVLGFGEAGAEIISSVLQEGIEAETNPIIPGKKIMGIYGFCDIRNFTDTTDVLEEKVMIFVNQVAEIVHEYVNDYWGCANKNIGDAFWLVWKFDKCFTTWNKNNNTLELKNCTEVNNLTDMALISFILIIMQVHKSFQLSEYKKHKELNERMNNYSVKLGFGLHLGYSIEGAIGSMFKIDASYLSPDVNMANKLEEKTKEYGKEMIISNNLYSYLSADCKKYLRLLDKIKTRNGEKIEYYSVDLDLSQWNAENECDAAFPVKESLEKKMGKIAINRKKAKTMYKNVINNKTKPWKEFEKNSEFIKCRKRYTKEFNDLYKLGWDYFERGSWNEAERAFLEAKNMLPWNDLTIEKKIDYIQEKNYISPLDWDGYIEEYEKKTLRFWIYSIFQRD